MRSDQQGRGLLALGLLTLCLFAVAACGGSGGSGTEQLFFGTNNIQRCSAITVDIDLEASAAEVSTRDDGSPDCDLTAERIGCRALFEQIDNGSTLRAVIDGCEIPERASLFGCQFSAADTAEVSAMTTGTCDCVGEPECSRNIYCLEQPNICVSPIDDPGACEDCFNNEDDDGDGFVDCDDRDCAIAECGFGQTTITCSTSTTSSTLSLRAPTE